MRILTPLLGVLLLSLALPAQAAVSRCFDHYNPEAWHGRGMGLVLCRNSPPMASCEVRERGGARLLGFVRHGSLDNGRPVWSDYNTLGGRFPFPVDLVCRAESGAEYTFRLDHGGRWADGCCRHRQTGACCDTPADAPADPPADLLDDNPDVGGAGDAARCPPFRSREFGAGLRFVDGGPDSGQRVSFSVDDLPAVDEVTWAAVAMHLDDADHPRQEGRVFVNGHEALSLPAEHDWNDEESDVVMGIPIDYLRPGTNLLEFGVGVRDRTYFGVSDVAVHVYGPACEPDTPGEEPPDPPPEGARWAGQPVGRSFPGAPEDPVELCEGDTLSGRMEVRNDGTASWDDAVVLAPTPRDRPSPLQADTWLSATRVTAADAETAPGEVATFSFDIHGGSVGLIAQTFGLVAEGQTWFVDGVGPRDDWLEVVVEVVACEDDSTPPESFDEHDVPEDRPLEGAGQAPPVGDDPDDGLPPGAAGDEEGHASGEAWRGEGTVGCATSAHWTSGLLRLMSPLRR